MQSRIRRVLIVLGVLLGLALATGGLSTTPATVQAAELAQYACWEADACGASPDAYHAYATAVNFTNYANVTNYVVHRNTVDAVNYTNLASYVAYQNTVNYLTWAAGR